MALTQINVGASANSGTGDPLRTAFQKTNTAMVAVDALDLAKVLGTWDASAGTFPAAAPSGKRYRVTIGGTVAGISFAAGDIINALIANPSTTVYVDNWLIEPHIGVEAYLEALPSGSVISTHGGANDSIVPGNREGTGAVGFKLGQGAFLDIAAEPAPTTIATATYTIQPSDWAKRLRFTHGAPTITIAAQATVVYSDGFYVGVVSDNPATIVCAAGVTGNGLAAKSWTLARPPGCASLERLSINAWHGLGALT